MKQAQRGDKVKVHYVGRLDDGTIFDTSEGREPLQFEVGGGKFISGFERAVEGMNPGQSKKVSIGADDAYGSYHDELIQDVPLEAFPSGLEPQVGQRFRVDQPNGHPMILTVIEISEETITLDGNHPLAGKSLNFEIVLVDIG